MKRIFSFVVCAYMLVAATMGVACKENNTDNGDPQVAVTAVTLNKAAVKLNPEATVQLTATVAPENATNKAVAWTSSKEEVATVSDAGLVTAVAEGEATITVTTEDGAKTASCKVTVEALEVSAESISLNYTELTLNPGDEETLVATVLPEAVENKDVKFRSSNSDVASVGRSTGVISAKANGEATITVTSYDNDEVTATCNVLVRTPVESFTLSSQHMVLIPGAKETLVATILPATASDKSVEWKSSNEAVATVENGEVTAVAEGEATITATTDNGAKTATCAVEVKAVDNENLLKVVSFNITVSNDDGTNYWSSRRGAIINFINTEKPDVMGLQEVTAHQLNYLKSKLSGYDHYGIDRGGNNNGYERTSIMYNTATVEVMEKGTFWLSPTPDTASKSWNDEIFAPVEGTPGAMKYHRTCTWVKFKRKADGKVFFYYNTHLEFGYHANYNLGQTAREKGVALVVERMKAKAANGEALIFGGDMNQVANDKCFNPLFNNGFVSGRVTATQVTSENNRNSITWNDYDAPSRDKQENNNYSPNSWNMIDHFFLKNCNAVEFRTIRDTNYGGEIDPKSNGGKYMADHFPVLITVAM
ncbi:MAG: Ig-like domain-containing protein [Alistipes sp.]|nr:Ig-like domain-containing protein [Alistipes sp.]